MRAHYFQHVPFEGLGSIAPWLESAGYTVSCTQFFKSVDLPDPEQVDFLIVMGGPMSANEEKQYPWLKEEKSFIRKLVHAGTPVLGICLGAQLIASSLGAAVYPNEEKEIGWFPVQGLSGFKESIFHFPSEVRVFHWHGETFDLPEGAVLLAGSSVCENQAFQIGESVIGLQFHLETTPDTAKAIVANCGHELIPSGFIRSEKEILSAESAHYQEINRLMEKVLVFLTGKS